MNCPNWCIVLTNTKKKPSASAPASFTTAHLDSKCCQAVVAVLGIGRIELVKVGRAAIRQGASAHIQHILLVQVSAWEETGITHRGVGVALVVVVRAQPRGNPRVPGRNRFTNSHEKSAHSRRPLRLKHRAALVSQPVCVMPVPVSHQ